MPDNPAFTTMPGPTLLHGLTRQQVIVDLATWSWGDPTPAQLEAAEKWLLERGFISPVKETE